MNLIFENGEKLYQSEKEKINNFLNNSGLKLYPYQQMIFNKMLEQNNKADFAVYGDDFKIKIKPINIDNNCVLSIADYNENQKFETDINSGYKNNYEEFCQVCGKEYCRMKHTWCLKEEAKPIE